MGLFGDIAAEINGTIDSLVNIFGGNSSHAYPTTISGIPITKITNSPNFRNGDWRSNRGYSFQVYRVKDSANAIAPGWAEFTLQINPQELQQDEVFAVDVTPTLRGVVVEHHGAILKDIVISGSTGISPMRREGGASNKTGRPILESGHSGFEEFHELRSYFRSYIEAKRLDARETGELRMVFKNYKDNEFLYVEPIKFSMKRSASRPMLYEYNISLKGIGVSGAESRSDGGLLSTLDDVIDTITDTLDTAVKITAGALGTIKRIEREIENTVLNPIRLINQGIKNIKSGKDYILNVAPTRIQTVASMISGATPVYETSPISPSITRGYIDTIQSNVQKAEGNINDAFGLDLTNYNFFNNRTSTYVAAPGRTPTFQEFQILNALAMMKKALLLIASQQDSLFEKNIFQVNKDIIDTYTNIKLDTPSSVRTIIIEGNDNIQIIAARELGDPDKYRDIVVLNNLKPPYIATTAANGVLIAGDKLLIPQKSSSSEIGIASNKKYAISAALSESEKNLGIDIELTSDGDLAISNTSDLNLVAGFGNISQAISARLSMEKGSLKRHLTLGTDLHVGAKVTPDGLSNTRAQIMNSLGSDPRIEGVPYLSLEQNGGTTTINMILKIRKFDQPVPIPIQVNNL